MKEGIYIYIYINIYIHKHTHIPRVYIHIHTHTGNSFCCTKETNTKQLYVNKKINKINCLRAEFLGQ